PVKSSKVYDAQGDILILAQTYPPLPESMRRKDIIVTFLTRRNGVMARHGFSARIVELIDYSLSSGEKVKALEVERIGEPEPYCVRMCYRVHPTNQSGLSMMIDGTKVSLIDISLGGAKVCYDESLWLESDTVAKASIDMDGRTYVIEAHLLRTWSGASEGFSDDLRFAALQFMHMPKKVEDALSQKIRDIERQALSKGILP
ncbi:MAG TPA: hypothetical protein VLW86_06545, partial [Syntrophorhabdales bacterium]|nr:hypothetical protein [Syntrophorhabdales bacterium]